MGIFAALRLAWGLRYVLLAVAVVAGALYVKQVFADRAHLKAELVTATQANKEMAEAFNALEAEKKRSEEILGKQMARKAAEADRLGKLVQHILSQEATNACVDSPAIRALLDGVRN